MHELLFRRWLLEMLPEVWICAEYYLRVAGSVDAPITSRWWQYRVPVREYSLTEIRDRRFATEVVAGYGSRRECGATLNHSGEKNQATTTDKQLKRHQHAGGLFALKTTHPLPFERRVLL